MENPNQLKLPNFNCMTWFSHFNKSPTHLPNLKPKSSSNDPKIPFIFSFFPTKHHRNNLQTTNWNHHSKATKPRINTKQKTLTTNPFFSTFWCQYKTFRLNFLTVLSWNNIKQITHHRNHSNSCETVLKQLSNTILSMPKSDSKTTFQPTKTQTSITQAKITSKWSPDYRSPTSKQPTNRTPTGKQLKAPLIN